MDFLIVFLFAAVLIRPYFKAKYTDKWASIESTFISDARFLIAHWPHPQWQPLWYTGTRFDYIYPPALRYGTAIISKVTGFWPVKAYHFYVSFFYAIGIAGVYLLMRIGTGSRGSAWLASVATALMSPTYLFMPAFRADAWRLVPQRIGVLVRYGEGPHMTALALIPIALAFTWLALDKRRPWAVSFAAVFCAGVVSNNFYGATSLAIFYPILVWSFWVTRRSKQVVVPAIVIPVLAYGLTAFWLVPSYLRVTSENMKYVAEPGNVWSLLVALASVAAFAAITNRFARGRIGLTWEVFVAGSVIFFSLYVLGYLYFNLRVTGDAKRLLPELDMVYIIAIAWVLRWMWNRPRVVLRSIAVVLTVAAFWTAKGYIRHAWEMFPLWPNYQSRVEYRVTDWLWKNMPDARVCPSGSVRFWYDAWHDLAQVGGGSDQGQLNAWVSVAQGETNMAEASKPAILWMQSMGVDAIYVADKQSEEVYKDVQYPQKLAGALAVLFDDQQGNRLYGVPRRYPARARVVETEKLNAARPARFSEDLENLEAYVAVIEQGPDSPAQLTHPGTDRIHLHATLERGQSIVVQETYDPNWHAWSSGQMLAIRKDVMGMMVIDASPGDHQIEMAFLTPFENRVGRVLTAIALLIVLASMVFSLFTIAPSRVTTEGRIS